MALKKAIAFLCFIFLGACAPAFAVTLAWDATNPNLGILQYNVYERLPTGYALVTIVIPPRTSVNLPPLTPGTHIFTVTAVSALMESAFSNEMTVSSFGSSLDFTNSTALPIVNASSIKTSGAVYPASITVSGVTQPIANVRVSLHGVTHSIASQVDVLLVGPQGQKVILMSDVGGRNPISSAELAFSDSAAVSLTTDPIQSGTYKPTNLNPSGQLDDFPSPAPARPYSKTLSAFTGTNANGTWQLFVVNDGLNGSGTITGGWSLKFDPSGAPLVTAYTPLSITSTTVNLNGLINPMGKSSVWAYYFGLTSNYTSAQATQDAGSGVNPVPAALSLTGLKPGTTYHFELVGANASGASTTDDMTFTTSPLVDSDGDGMPDDYELLNHLNPNSAADSNKDSDGDGLTNLQEYLAGTNPNDNRSVLRITNVQRSPVPSITFPTVTGKRYQLQRSSALAPANWVVIYNEVPGTGQSVTLEDSSGAGLTTAFYRAVAMP